MSAVPSLQSFAPRPASIPERRFTQRGAPAVISLTDVRSTELMRRYQKDRDDESFASLYALNLPRIRRLVDACLRYGAPDLDGEEIVQNAFISIVRSAHGFRPEQQGAFRVWSAQIARNAVRRALRDRRRRTHGNCVPLQESTPARQAPIADRSIESELCAALPMLMIAAAGALDRLAPRDRAALVDADVRGMSYASIAASLRLRPASLRMVLMRARQRWCRNAEKILAGR